MSGTLGDAGALHAADRSVSAEVRLQPGAAVPWRALLVGALLSLALGVALYEGLTAGHSSVASATHVRASSHKKGLSSLPLAAQGPVSQALGAEDPAYRVSPAGGGFAAVSSAQRLSTRFSRSGISLSSGATHVGLSVRAVGYGSSLNALDAVAPRVKANR